MEDRQRLDTDELAELIASIQERGQQVPIEVVALDGGRYGLISGWRRLRVLHHLARQAPPSERTRFSQVLSVLHRPSCAAEAYRAMVEENEIRANLSYCERACIAARAAGTGASADARAAVNALFVAGSRAKRSKIGSFLTVIESLDDRLHYGAAIPERLGLKLAKALDTVPALRETLRERLRKAMPDSTAKEIALLTRALSPAKESSPESQTLNPVPGVHLAAVPTAQGLRVTLHGSAVDQALVDQLKVWLKSRS